MRNAYFCVKQTQVIIYFGNGTYCRTRISGGGFLIYGYCRRKSFNIIYIGFFHSAEKESCVRWQWFYVSALTFGIKCVECQRRFARSWKSGNHNEFLTRNFQIDDLEVVHPRSFYAYCFVHSFFILWMGRDVHGNAFSLWSIHAKLRNSFGLTLTLHLKFFHISLPPLIYSSIYFLFLYSIK